MLGINPHKQRSLLTGAEGSKVRGKDKTNVREEAYLAEKTKRI